MNRRGCLQALAATTLGACAHTRSERRPSPARLAVCNEIFRGWKLRDACRLARESGYTGIEITPATLADDPAALAPDARREIRDTISGEGMTFVGLHFILKAPKGLHITTPDEALRARSWDYLRRLTDLCADLGDGGIMVLGSGNERRTVDGASRDEATRRLRDGLAGLAPHAQERGVTFLLEPLAPNFSDVVNSLGEAVEVVRQVNHPAVRSMFDFHNAIAESVAHADLVRRHFSSIRHVHLNEIDGRHPGTGHYDFKPVMATLRELRYTGWISLEVFDAKSDPRLAALQTTRFIRNLEAEL